MSRTESRLRRSRIVAFSSSKLSVLSSKSQDLLFHFDNQTPHSLLALETPRERGHEASSPPCQARGAYRSSFSL